MSKRKLEQEFILPSKKTKVAPTITLIPLDIWKHEIISLLVLTQDEFFERGYGLQPGRRPYRRYKNHLACHWPVVEEFHVLFLRPLLRLTQVCQAFHKHINEIIMKESNHYLFMIISVGMEVFRLGIHVLDDPPVKRSPHTPTLGKRLDE